MSRWMGSRTGLLLLALSAVAAAPAQPGPASAPAPAPAPAAEQSAMLSGQIAVVGGTVDLATLRGSVNGLPVRIAADGTISASVADADYYQVAIEGPGVFASTHTFGYSEVARPGGAIALPRIEVVARAPGRTEMFFGGDVMMGRRFEEPIWNERTLIAPATRAADMQRLLQPMRPYFAGSDLASVNLETVLATSTPGDAPDKSVVFFTNSDAARALSAIGVDYVSLGNNHVYDFLEPGLDSTIAALDAAGIAHAGAGPNEESALKAARISVGATPYSLLGYVGWKGKVEPNQVADSAKGGAAFGSDDNIRASVRRETAAGRLPIVQYHGSSEYSARPTDVSERRMKLAIDSGAVLVVSHHPHVPQGLELYKGRLIAYSLGNFLFDQYFPETQASIALKVWMDGDTLFRAEIVPIQILDYRPVPATGNFRASILRRIAALSAERGTYIAMSGGHGVVTPASTVAPVEQGDSQCGSSNGVLSLPFDLAGGPTLSATCAAAGSGLTYGHDLLLRGDFENARYADATDRSWAVGGATMRFGGPAHNGRAAMILTAAAGGKPMLVGPSTFYRPTEARRYTLTGWLRSPATVKLEASVQAQPSGSNRFRALETAPVARVGLSELPGGAWQPFRFDFDAPVGAKGDTLPMRPLLRIAGTGEIAFDDLALIAWEDPKADRAMRSHAIPTP